MNKKIVSIAVVFSTLCALLAAPATVHAEQPENDTVIAYAEVLDENGEIKDIYQCEIPADEDVYFHLVEDGEGLTRNIIIASDRQPVIVPLWDYVKTIGLSLSFSGTTATMGISVSASSSVTKISVSPVLYRKSGSTLTNIYSSSKTNNSFTCIWSGTKTVTKGYTYRLSNTTKAYTTSSTTAKETINTYIEKVCS